MTRQPELPSWVRERGYRIHTSAAGTERYLIRPDGAIAAMVRHPAERQTMKFTLVGWLIALAAFGLATLATGYVVVMEIYR